MTMFNLDELSDQCPRIVLKPKEKPQKTWYEAYTKDRTVWVYREDRYGSGPVTTLIATLDFPFIPVVSVEGNSLKVEQ